ncbi:hypothetical protein E2C01_093644 [Portunus trituberculatus]|uniref:Uncharacterized protein n=1 Tax=Portunus trituberculatus TaxID=210409 RepID=A0A5B7JJP2_PORTR|nr:hypothetical protein [Portunus trituberculatus]
MLLPYLLRWVALITISYLYLALFLQSLFRIPQSGGASGVLPLWNDYCFRVRDPSLCVERISKVIVSGMGVYIP